MLGSMLVEGTDLKCVRCLRWSSEYPAGPSRRMWGPPGSLPAVLMWRTTIAYHRVITARACATHRVHSSLRTCHLWRRASISAPSSSSRRSISEKPATCSGRHGTGLDR